MLTGPKRFGVILAQSSFSFPPPGPLHWCGDPGLPWALATAKQGPPQTALPVNTPTQALCLHLPTAPCAPAETNSASSRCRASVPGLLPVFMLSRECPPSPYLEDTSNHSLLKAFLTYSISWSLLLYPQGILYSLCIVDIVYIALSPPRYKPSENRAVSCLSW